MRLSIFISILLIFGCVCSFGQQIEEPPPQPAKTKVKTLTFDVVELLLEKPDWLYPFDSCPADVISTTETEVEYLAEGCTENPLRCLAKCKNDDGNACYALAILLQKEQGLEKDYNEALFLRSCKLGVVSGCTNRAAGMLNIEAKSEKNNKCAADTFEKTCAKNDSWGCSMYGFILMEGIGREVNLLEAKKHFQKACTFFGEKDAACLSAKEMEKKIDESLKQTKP